MADTYLHKLESRSGEKWSALGPDEKKPHIGAWRRRKKTTT